MARLLKKINLEFLVIVGMPLSFIVFSVLKISDGKTVSDGLCYGFIITYIMLCGILAGNR